VMSIERQFLVNLVYYAHNGSDQAVTGGDMTVDKGSLKHDVE
jgi:hypothetical protein